MKLKNVWFAGAFAAALLLGACNKDDDKDNKEAVNAQDNTFLLQAYQSNNAEVSLGNLAQAKGTNDSVKMYARMMVTEHTTAQSDLTNVVNNVNTDASFKDSLNAQQVQMRTMLSALSGRAFDSAYIASQVLGHQQTLAAFNTEISGGQSAQVKGYATKYQPAIQNHLTLANQIFAQLP